MDCSFNTQNIICKLLRYFHRFSDLSLNLIMFSALLVPFGPRHSHKFKSSEAFSNLQSFIHLWPLFPGPIQKLQCRSLRFRGIVNGLHPSKLFVRLRAIHISTSTRTWAIILIYTSVFSICEKQRTISQCRSWALLAPQPNMTLFVLVSVQNQFQISLSFCPPQLVREDMWHHFHCRSCVPGTIKRQWCPLVAHPFFIEIPCPQDIAYWAKERGATFLLKPFISINPSISKKDCCNFQLSVRGMVHKLLRQPFLSPPMSHRVRCPHNCKQKEKWLPFPLRLTD